LVVSKQRGVRPISVTVIKAEPDIAGKKRSEVKHIRGRSKEAIFVFAQDFSPPGSPVISPNSLEVEIADASLHAWSFNLKPIDCTSIKGLVLNVSPTLFPVS
jgi:hypothetical protein